MMLMPSDIIPSPHPRNHHGLLAVLAVTIVATILCFWKSGSAPLKGDEAQYALATDSMRHSGNWLDLIPSPPVPAFQKPPLYVWLTAGFYRPLAGLSALDQPEARYRIWSATFAMLTAVFTTWLAGQMFNPAVGTLAGLLLTTNYAFLFYHGARSGTFDTGVTLCHLLGITLWWRGRNSPRFWRWIAIGALCGVASMLKPLAGAPTFLIIIALDQFDRGDSMLATSRMRGIAVAASAFFIVAAPWYIIETVRFDGLFLSQMFRLNIIRRATVGVDPQHLHGFFFYFNHITRSSAGFVLALPALAWAIYQTARSGAKRIAWATIAAGGLGWVLIFSASASKADHYVFPAYPFIAIAIAAGCAELGAFISRSLSRSAFWATIVCLLALAAHRVNTDIYSNATPYPPIEIYRQFRSNQSDAAPIVTFVGFPPTQEQWQLFGLTPSDRFYLQKMQPAESIESPSLENALPALRQHIRTLSPSAGQALVITLKTSPCDQAWRVAGRGDEVRLLRDEPLFSMWSVTIGKP